jgi:hypothetical protein
VDFRGRVLNEPIARGGRPAPGFGLGSITLPAASASAGVSSVARALAGSAASAGVGLLLEHVVWAAWRRARGRP